MIQRVPLVLAAFLLASPLVAAPLPGTAPLTLEGDIASQLVDGVDRFLLKQIAETAKRREANWKPDELAANRERLRHILGVRDPRVSFSSPELVATLEQPALVGKGIGYEVFAVRWPAFGDVHGEGLLLVPIGRKPTADVVAIPDADVTPEQYAGLMPGLPLEMQYARRLADNGCRVLVPTLIDRTYEARNKRAKMTNREFIYRSAFVLGRHLIGYEVQKVLAGVDWFTREKEKRTIAVIGHGEGGMIALFAGALDDRIGAVGVSGYIDNRDTVWQQPIDRNVFGLLERFGDAELLAMIAPRPVVVGQAKGPELTLPSEGGAPGKLVSPNPKIAQAEAERAEKLAGRKFVSLAPHADAAFTGGILRDDERILPEHLRKGFDPALRQKRQLAELDRHNQQLLEESPYTRAKFMEKLDTSSPEKFKKSQAFYHDYFDREVIGRFDLPLLPANPRTRVFQESDKYTMYQVVLDVFPDVIAYGLLIVPKNLKDGERRPVVVCQHGLEGRPEWTIGEKEGYASYKAFATRLAERGFVTFAPQNLYIFRDRFRTLQRKANPLGKTLFSVIVPQHKQITAWLKTLPFVDGKRIAFYGLSYGGKSAMRIPALVDDYCLSICSADFNDWVWKNASTRSPYSYVWTMEYEIFEFDLGSTFNYSEMAALIAPRPFMVERGHFDGVAPDERVALEFAKIRNLFQARLGLGDRATIEWFVGPHTINGKGTFAFLHKHLDWPASAAKE
jgi:dienelactone hydrolase